MSPNPSASSRRTHPRDEESDAQLLESCAAGNREAWGHLVRRYKDLVFSTAIKVGLDRDDAGDVFQEVFLELHRSAARIRKPEALAGWLMVATRRLSYKHVTKRRRMLPEIGRDLADPASLPDEQVIAAESRLRIEAGLARLGEQCAKLLRHLFFNRDELSYDQIAESMNLARGSIGPIRGRCLGRLKKILEEL